jgi:drug/metabolite transporter (DMT)-like permease
LQEIGLAFAITSAFFLGANKLPVRLSLFNIDESVASVISILIAIPMFGIPLLFYSLGRYPSLETIAILSLAGIINNGVGRYFIWKSISNIGANRANILAGTQVVYAVMIAVLFLGQPIDLYSGSGVALVLFGVYLLSAGPSKGSGFARGQLRAGLIFGLIGGFLWGVAQVLMQVGVLQYRDPTMDVFITFTASLAGAIPIALVVKGSSSTPLRFSRRAALMILVASVMSNLGLFFRYQALVNIPLTIVSTVNATNPIFTLFFSYLLIKNVEMINTRVVLAIVVSVVGVALMSF